MAFEVKPATGARFADVCTILGPKKPGAQGCWCLGYRLGHAEEQKLVGPARAEFVGGLCRRRAHAPGVLAYADGDVVGWAAVSPLSELHESSTSKRYPHIDDQDVWIVFCFRTRAGQGKQGVAHALLAGAVEYAASKGAPAIEGYPVDNDGAKIDRTFAYPGTRAMFERAGFRKVGDVAGKHGGFTRVVMRKVL
ncbi:MAG: GNAT family N-acetyltransferase [Tetrasphaera sp.]